MGRREHKKLREVAKSIAKMAKYPPSVGVFRNTTYTSTGVVFSTTGGS